MKKMRLALIVALLTVLATAAWAAGPATTTISDTVYRADGTAASGTVLLSWPSFVTAEGDAVAAGNKSVEIGRGGAFITELVPNTGAIPSGTFYQAVFQLDDGTVRTETWSVPSESPTTIALIRTSPGLGTANPLASQQYVNATVAGRALDTTVVHLSGGETITGAKQFATPPAVPAPLGANDAVNKAYVDAALANVGSGSYVSKTGDTMSGPLALAGDPISNNQASTKHYVDLGLAGKAGLVNGLIPPNQLGTGNADGTTCLLGNSMWGPCGTSANATALQNTPISSQAPTDGQILAYNAGNNAYAPTSAAGAASVYATTYYAIDYQFTHSPTDDLSSPGAKTVNLASCPRGVHGNLLYGGSTRDYYVYIAGTGTPEAVKVTGGTCTGNGNAGTLQFTTANSHPAGYTITSATSGIAEALAVSSYSPRTGYPQSQGRIVAPTGNYPIYGQLTIRGWGQTVDFSAGIAQCYSSTTPCLYIGDSANSNAALDNTVIGFKGWPKAVGSTQPMIEVNAQKTRLVNLGGMYDPSGGTFGYWVKVDDDQALLLDGLSTTTGLGNIRCDSTFCGSIVWANGSFSANPQRAPVGWIKNSNFNLQCMADGIDWQSGNTLRISDSVIQGYPHFGVRYSNSQGGYGGMQMENVYMETGSCSVRGPVAIPGAVAGVIMQGNSPYTNPSLSIRGGEGPQGAFPTFASGGSTQLNYYVVAILAGGQKSVPLYAGSATPANSGTSIPVKWYDLPPSASYDLLVSTGGGSSIIPPYGTGTYAVVTGLSQSSICANGVCSYTDTQGARASYGMGATWLGNGPSWTPKIDNWPGSVILSPAAADQGGITSTNNPALYTDLYSSVDTYISAAGGAFPQIFAASCTPAGPGPNGYNWVVCAGTNPWNQLKLTGGVQRGGQNSLKNLKGTLNLGYNSATNGPTHLVTLFDFTPEISQAYGVARAPNSANDTFLGIDSSNTNSAVGLSLGSSGSISNYIANNGDGTSWLERLTGTKKEFKVPLQLDTITGKTQCLHVDASGTISGTGSECGSGGGGGGAVASVFGRTGTVTAQAGDYTAAQVTGAALDNAVLHLSGDETVGGTKTFTQPVSISTGSATLFEGVKQAGSGVTLDSGYDFGFFLRSDNALGCQLSAALGSGSCFNVSQVTGAAADSGVVHNAGTETIAGTKTFTSDVTLSGSLNVAGTINQTGSGPWQLSGMKWTGTTATVADGRDFSLGVGSDNSLKCQLASGGSCLTVAGVQGAAPLASPALSGTPTAPTPGAGDSSTKIATTAWVQSMFPPMWITAVRGGTTAPGIQATAGTNQVTLWGAILPYPIRTTMVTYNVQTADNSSNLYDLGIYDSAGSLVVHTGATPGSTAAAVTGPKTLGWTTATLQPGKYYLAITTNCSSSCAGFVGDGSGAMVTFLNAGTAAVTSGGTLNTGIVIPADAYSWGAKTPAWIVR